MLLIDVILNGIASDAELNIMNINTLHKLKDCILDLQLYVISKSS